MKAELVLHPSESKRTFRILYAEDNLADVLLLKTVLNECDFKIEMHSVDDGEKALEFLNRSGRYVGAKRPHLILLDLNLPRVTGDEVLLKIKSDPALKTIPVVVFSSAADEKICNPIYHEYANTCIRKPSNLDDFLETVKQTCSYWFHIACLPLTSD